MDMVFKVLEWVFNLIIVVLFCYSRILLVVNRWIWIGLYGEKSCKKRCRNIKCIVMFDEILDNVNYILGVW